MATTRQDIVIPQSGTFRMTISVVGISESLEGYTCEMQVRKSKEGALLAEVGAEAFTIDEDNQRVVLQIPSEATEVYDWDGTAVYDLYLVSSGGERWRMLEGIARLSKTVTREEV